MSTLRRMELILDDDDYDAIQAEITRRQTGLRCSDGGMAGIPDGESNIAGAVLAEVVRGFWELMGLRPLNTDLRPHACPSCGHVRKLTSRGLCPWCDNTQGETLP